MKMTNKNSSRKPVQPTISALKNNADIKVLHIEREIITTPRGSKCYLKRFKYKGCPELNGDGSFKTNTLIDMGRDSVIRDVHELLSSDLTNTASSRYSSLIHYFRWHDTEGSSVTFEWDSIDKYMTWCSKEHSLGRLTKSTWSTYRKAISWVLKKKGRTDEAKRLPPIKGVEAEARSSIALVPESELKPVAQALFRAYRELRSHWINNTLPERHPLFDKERLNKVVKDKGLTKNSHAAHIATFKRALNKVHPNNHIVRIAMMICFMFTGMNYTPLARLKISDIRFKALNGGVFIIESTKGRANHQDQDNAIGFSKHAKEFIEGWVSISKQLTNNNNDYLFPYFTDDGRVLSYAETSITPQDRVNKLLSRLELPRITSSILRKTKLDTLFRVTESVYLVSQAANNSMAVTAKTYIEGTKGEHERNLASAMEAQYAISQGEKINDAIEKAKNKYTDVLTGYDYQRLRKAEDRSHESRTPIGVRCNDNTKGSSATIKRILEKSGIEMPDTEEICTSFLDCFECEHHALVADEMDIWLMLSFRETLQQLQQIPAVNSLPKEQYATLLQTIDSVLARFKQVSEFNYQQAEEKLKVSSHPLYSNVYSLNDLFEVFS